MSYVLITGATGRVGANLVADLLARGHEVRALVMPGDPAVRKLDRFAGLETVPGGLGDQAAIDRAVEGTDTIVHLGAQIALADTAPDQYFDTNSLGTLRLLESAVKYGARRFILASTDGTYDVLQPEASPIDEGHPQVPGDRYGTSKLVSEILVQNYAKQWGLHATIVRFGSVIAIDEVLSVFRLDSTRMLLERAAQGPASTLWPLMKGHEGALERLPARADNPAVVLRGPDGTPWALHLTDVRDTIAGTTLAIESSAAVGDAFNIVGPGTVTFAESAEVLTAALGIEAVEIEMPVTLAFEISYAKAAAILGYEPQWTYRRMVDSALAFAAGGTEDAIPVVV